MNVFELAISEFGYFGFLCGLIGDLKYICDFAIDSSLVCDDFGFEIHLMIRSTVLIIRGWLVEVIN
jgi:hypothetical protein